MIIFDLDGTLADCEHRRHFVDSLKNSDFEIANGKKFTPNWDAFHEACDQDIPIDPVIQILWKFHVLDECIEIWSGRSESVRSKTQEWLHEHVFFQLNFKQYNIPLKMRPIGDYTPDDQLKESWLDEALADGKNIECVFDDRPKVVRMWKRRGIFVFNCNQKDKEVD